MKARKQGELIEAAGARLMFLPPYGPDFNPIENAFAKVDYLLLQGEADLHRRWPLDGHRPLVGTFSPAECANYFAAAGYDPD